MTNLSFLIKSLSDKNDTVACGAMKVLAELSEQSNEVYAYMDTFTDMLESENSYVRNRGLILIAANARWDRDFKIDEIIDDYLKHITDPKPITARQCITSLPKIAKSKPDIFKIVSFRRVIFSGSTSSNICKVRTILWHSYRKETILTNRI